MNNEEQKIEAAIQIIARLKSNHHNLRALLKDVPTHPKLDDLFDSLNYEEGMLDALVIILTNHA